jgi:hypothetical protein
LTRTSIAGSPCPRTRSEIAGSPSKDPMRRSFPNRA